MNFTYKDIKANMIVRTLNNELGYIVPYVGPKDYDFILVMINNGILDNCRCVHIHACNFIYYIADIIYCDSLDDKKDEKDNIKRQSRTYYYRENTFTINNIINVDIDDDNNHILNDDKGDTWVLRKGFDMVYIKEK